MSLVQLANGNPIVQIFSCDCTPLRLPHRIQVTVSDHKRSKTGRKTTELLVMSSFIRSKDPNGLMHSRLAFHEPMALPKVKGKTSQSLYQHGAKWFKTLGELGHQGISIQHFVMAKAGFDLLCDHWEAHIQHKSSGHCPSGMSADFWALLTWVVRTPCALHSLHNSLKWSMFAQFEDLQLIKDLWAVFASLRESFDFLETHLLSWLDT